MPLFFAGRTPDVCIRAIFGLVAFLLAFCTLLFLWAICGLVVVSFASLT